MKKIILSFILLGTSSLFWGCSDDPSPIAPAISEIGSSASVAPGQSSAATTIIIGMSSSAIVIGVRDTTKEHRTVIIPLASTIKHPDMVDDSITFCWTPGCEATVVPRSSSSKQAPSTKSSSSNGGITIETPENKAPTINGMTMTDTRDNHTYKLMQIGGKLWMAQDINYAGTTSECYNEQESKCSSNGRLYTFNSAQKACPKGWHLPTRSEAQAALDDASVPWSYSGRCKDGDCNFLGDMGFHWTSGTPESNDKKFSENGGANGGLIIVEKSPDYFTPKEDDPDDKAKFFQVDSKTKRFSVRCVQD